MLKRPMHDDEPMIVVLVLSSPTGLYVAVRLLGAGMAMLRRNEDAAIRARGAARWAIGPNICLLAALFTCALFASPQMDTAVLLTFVYPVVSIIHAALLQYAANKLDAYTEAQTAAYSAPSQDSTTRV